MPRHGGYPAELRERAVRMVLDHEHECGSQWEAITSVSEKLGPTLETVGSWVVGLSVTLAVGLGQRVTSRCSA